MESFKYRCRGCRMQTECIEASNTSQGAKDMIRNAFAARTDTTSTWAVLQKNCLLVKLDEEHEKRARERSNILSRRLQEARSTTQEIETSSPEETSRAPQSGPLLKPSFSMIIGESPEPPPTIIATPPRPSESATALFPAEPQEIIKTNVLEPPLTTRPFVAESALAYWLIISVSQRRISLPFNGELNLGRFDPSLTTPLDV